MPHLLPLLLLLLLLHLPWHTLSVSSGGAEIICVTLILNSGDARFLTHQLLPTRTALWKAKKIESCPGHRHLSAVTTTRCVAATAR